MGLLGDSWDDPKTMATLQLAAGLLSPGSFGQNLGRGMGAYQGTLAADQDMKFKKAQIDEYAAHTQQRQLEAAKQQKLQEFIASKFGQAPNITQGTQPQSVALTPEENQRRAMQSSQASSAAPSGAAPSFPMNFNDTVMLKTLGGPDLLPAWKVATEGIEQKAGSSYIGTDGVKRYNADPTKGITLDASGRVSTMAGAPETMATLAGATADAQEKAKARYSFTEGYDPLMKAPYKTPTLKALGINDGHESTQSDSPKMGAQNPTTPSASSVPANRAAEQIAPATQASRDGEAVRVIQNEILKEKDPTARAGLQRELTRLQGGGIQTGPSATDKNAATATDEINKTWLNSSYTPTVNKGEAAKDLMNGVTTARLGLQLAGPTGWSKEAQIGAARVLGALGVPQAEKAAAGAQIFQTSAMTRLNAVLNQAAGVQTEGDAQRAAKTFASLGNTPQANQFILDMTEALAQRDQKKAAYFKDALPLAQKTGDLQMVDRKWQEVEPSVWSMPSLRKWK